MRPPLLRSRFLYTTLRKGRLNTLLCPALKGKPRVRSGHRQGACFSRPPALGRVFFYIVKLLFHVPPDLVAAGTD